MIKDHKLVPNQEARLGAIKQRKLQVQLWWEKNCCNLILAITVSAYNTSELNSYTTQVNIESLPGEDINVAHSGKV